MILISPIDQLGEAEPLLDAGADELYGGWLPEDWLERYRLLASINQRTFAGAQIAGYEDLQEIVQRAHDRGKRFSLTLNAPFYSDEQLPLLFDYVDQAVTALALASSTPGWRASARSISHAQAAQRMPSVSSVISRPPSTSWACSASSSSRSQTARSTGSVPTRVARSLRRR